MKLNWADYGTLLSGIFFFVLHLLSCYRFRQSPSLPVAITAITTGGGVFFGAILVLTPFVESLQSLPPRPEYLVIAGVAVLWVSIQYGWGLWSGPRSALTEQAPSAPRSSENTPLKTSSVLPATTERASDQVSA